MNAEIAQSSGPSGSPPSALSAQCPSSSPNATQSHNLYPRKTSNGYSQPPIGTTTSYTTSPVATRRSIEYNSPPRYTPTDEMGFMSDGLSTTSSAGSTIVLRKLPSTMNTEALASMLLFVDDFLDAKFVATENPEDAGFQTAVARFRTTEGASEARKLNGRLNATNDANLIVESYQAGGMRAPATNRRTSDGQAGRQLSTSASSGSSNGNGFRQPSRYSGTFQSLDKLSPTKVYHTSPHAIAIDGTSPPHSIFAPQSPTAIVNGGDRQRVSGKSVINDDTADDETGDILRDPLAFAKNGHSGNTHRSPTTQGIPIQRLANLHLNTNSQPAMDGAMSSNYNSARTLKPLQSPVSEFSPSGMPPMSPTHLFSISPQFQRTHFPPANPADQNPPCNTLYVGNLPVDASEDELKALFSKQRGYKRLCFRTKHNGPMCFVEFEDITFATKALNELYGTMLHNSIKGGIRLSFSKNPLGVRAGQGNGMGPTTPLGSPGLGFGNGIGAPPGFSSASGPPPGLAMPPGLSSPISIAEVTSPNSASNPKYFSMNGNPLSPGSAHFAMRTHTNGNSYNLGSPNGNAYSLGSPNGNSGFPDYMLGR